MTNEVELLDFLAKRLRIRVESGRDRLDMKKVIHLEILWPAGWVPISTVDFDGGGLDKSYGTNGFRL